jgi:hypothetical protein
MADFSHEISVDNAIGAANSTQSPSARALSSVEPPQSESGLFSGESVLNILKLIFAGAPLTEVLTIIARLVEAQGKGMFCTIWLLDKEGRYVRCATAPSLPGFISNWDRTPVGPDGACCGTAIYRREPVYVTDIRSDPLGTAIVTWLNHMASAQSGRGLCFRVKAKLWALSLFFTVTWVALAPPTCS